MLDLKTFSRSLKFTWIQKYLNSKNNEKWKIFFDYHLSRYGGPFIFSCNIRKEDIKYLEISNQFLNEILELWAEVHFIEKDCLDQNAKKKQSIWNNSYIRIGNKPVYYNNWIKNGILNIEQLLDTQDNPLKYEGFKEKFQNLKTHFLEYMAIVLVTKNFLKPDTYVNEKMRETTTITIPQVVSESKLNRLVYNTLLKETATVPNNSQLKWARDLGTCQDNVSNIDWKIAYSLSFSCTVSTCLRSFHFKYLHRRIPTNVFLAKCQISPTEKCTFCKNEPETLIHLFLQCPFTNQCWQNILNWIKTYPNCKNVKFCEIMLLGLANCEIKILNLMLLIARYCIFLSKLRIEYPTLAIYKEKVKFFHLLEKESASQQGKLVEFLKKWRPFSVIF